MSLFFSKRDTTGWKRFAQLFNPFSKSKDITVSMGDNLSMISRCIINETSEKSADSSAYVIVVLVNNQIVNADFHFDSFEDFATKVVFVFFILCSYPCVFLKKRFALPI